MNDFLRAVGLLTSFPVHAPIDDSAPPGRTMAFFPLVGALLGGLLAGFAWLLGQSGLADAAPLLPAALLLAAWAGLTGALHLDGWADCCDALFVPVSRERRLEILKDPRLGGFGAVGLLLLLLVKLAALQGILRPLHDPQTLHTGYGLQATLILVAAPALARWAMVIAAYAYPSARPGGMGDFFRRGLGRRELILASLVAAAVCLPLLWRGLILWAVAAVVLLALARLAVARLNGLTGDVYGAIAELAETTLLVVACLLYSL